MFIKFIMNSSELKNYIRNRRSTLSESSINTYASIIRSLHKNVFGSPDVEASNLEKSGEILKFLESYPPNKRKTTLSALVIATDNNKDYRDLMMQDIKDYKAEMDKQEKTDKQKEAWVTKDEVSNKLKELEADAKVLYKKNERTGPELQRIQNYIILLLLGGVHDFPVRRSKDYVDFKTKNIDKEKDNYMDSKGNIVFNSYKTAKSYGQQKITVPTKVKSAIRKWIKVNPTDYLLFDNRLNSLGGPSHDSATGSVKLNQRLQKIFGKPTAVNALRHSSLTHKYSSLIEQKEDIDKTMTGMGSSSAMLETYVKK